MIGKKLIDPIERKSASVIQATLKANQLAAGTYDVTVVNPDGARATLSQALTVHEGTSVATGCSCAAVSPTAAMGVLALAYALRRMRRRGPP
ncbi:MAG: hypothetical protein IRZ16_06070 [Myxococcaceae bacterium]|nr:hypothetical protein [Myxococcaceae bacterium]